MNLLIAFVSRQTVVQAAIIKQADPDYILFFTTPKAAEEKWYEQLPMIVSLSGKKIEYKNIFIDKTLTMTEIVDVIKFHVREKIAAEDVKKIVLDSSSGKGIHRITAGNYLKQLTQKVNIPFSMIYFDPDVRKIYYIKVHEKSFSQETFPVEFDWNIKERIEMYGASLREYKRIYDDKSCWFEGKDSYNSLFDEICSDINLRSYFLSFENIKEAASKYDDESIVKKFIEKELLEVKDKLSGIIPRKDTDSLSAIKDSLLQLKERFVQYFKEEYISKPKYFDNYSEVLKSSETKLYQSIDKIILANFTEIEPKVKSKITALASETTFAMMQYGKTLRKINQVNFPEQLYNSYSSNPLIDETGEEVFLTNRTAIANVFEKLVSYAVCRAIKKNPILKESITSVYQNVKIDKELGTMIELDTMVVFGNGHIHIFEAKSSQTYNKDINSRLLVIRKYLGRTVEMDLVFPWASDDLEKLETKDRHFMSLLRKKGVRHTSTWINFISRTDKNITPLDQIETRLLSIAERYL